MACCKAVEYSWCEKEDTIKCRDGNDYCIFHAPAGEKGVPENNYNVELSRKIINHHKKDDYCNLSGTIFEWDINFLILEKKEFPININFDSVVFHGKVNIDGSTFGNMWFRNTTFYKNVLMKNSTFGKTSFFSTKFYNDLYFNEVYFLENVSFSDSLLNRGMIIECTFKGLVKFFDVDFEKDITFFDSTFEKEADFRQVRFHGSAGFESVKFNKVNFVLAQMHDGVFTRTEFSQDAYFAISLFNSATFASSVFHAQAEFAEVSFNKTVDFTGAFFHKRAYFMPMDTKKYNYLSENFQIFIDRSPEVFGDGCIFIRVFIFDNFLLEKVNLSKTSFIDTDVRQIEYVNCDWLEEGGQRILYDHNQLRNPDLPEEQEDLIRKVETLYRRFKQKAKENHDEAEASLWHYGEKEMQRQRGGPGGFFSWVLINLYCACSGYAERPVRAFYFFIGLIFFFALLLAMTKDGINHGLGELLISTLQYATFEKEPIISTEHTWGMVVKLGAKLLLPLQAALMALAIRNRFRR